MPKDLQQLRQDIDTIDKQLIALFCKRMDIVKLIIYDKIKNNKAIYDANREKTMLAEKLRSLPNPTLACECELFLKSLIDISKAYQEKIVGETQGK